MRCTSCGNDIPVEAGFCPHCGARCGARVDTRTVSPGPSGGSSGGGGFVPMNSDPQWGGSGSTGGYSGGSSYSNENNYGNNYGGGITDVYVDEARLTDMPELSMKWHKFLIYVSLWLGAAVNLLNAFQLLTGTYYGADSAAIYAMFPGMKAVDMIYGVALLALCAYIVMTRMKLAKFELQGITMLKLSYIIAPVVGIVYLFITSAISGVSMGDLGISNQIGTLIGGAIWYFVNDKYYNNRIHLFH